PSGRLMPKAHRHENAAVSQPPSSGPTAAMPPIVEPQTANAMARWRPVKVALSSDSVAGRIIAPPSPCTTRDRISSSPFGESAAATLETANSTTPRMSIRRRPMRSARVPKTSSSAAKTRVYDSCTHCTWVDERPMSSTTEGIATFTIVESTMMSETATEMTTRPSQRRRSVGVEDEVTDTPLLSALSILRLRGRIRMSDRIEDWPTGRLLSVAARLVEQRWRERLDEVGLTHAGLIVLHLLVGGGRTLGELAREARVTAQTMGRTVENLARDGRVRIVVDPSDRRRRVVERTELGAQTLASLSGLEGDAIPGLSDPDGFRTQLLQLIRRVGGDTDIGYRDAR